MPSNAYFEALTAAVLVDADEVKGFLQQQSPEERHALVERMHERIVETFTKLLEVEIEQAGQLQAWQETVEKVRQAAQEAAGEASLAQAMGEMDAFVHHAIPDYDAFLLKAGLRIRKAFVDTLTK
jgi:acyl-CoA reductase-like NAD-dependent aldehyde dehydrogenase